MSELGVMAVEVKVAMAILFERFESPDASDPRF